MKGYRDNGGGGGGFGARNKTVYDDVFGGPPKFGATTLPPRLEDYTEIFQGFHASRGSSIPVLDLPPPYDESDDVWCDVQTSMIDYSEVFGGFNGLDFAVSYEELFKSSKVVDDDSSDDAWTPAQSLSDESESCAVLEMNQQNFTAEPNQLFGLKLPNEPNLKAENDVFEGTTNDSQFLDFSGSTVLDKQAHPSKIENEKLFSVANSDQFTVKEFGRVTEGKQLKKSFSQPLDRVCGKKRYGSDVDHPVGNQKAYPVDDKPVLSVSDLSLKTQPSHLPPPSRPPPALTSKKVDTDSFNSKLKTSKSYAFERMTGNRSPPYFDVEIDATSSAAADAAAMKDAVEQAQAKLKSAKELMDRKKEGRHSRSKQHMENSVGDNKRRANDYFERSDTFGAERMKGYLKRYSTIARLEHGEINTPSEAEENELYENLIEIQLKGNDIETVENLVGFNEKVVTENRLEKDNEGKEDVIASASFEWVDYDVGLREPLEEGDKKGLKETQEQDQKEHLPETTILKSKEEDDRDIEERIINDSFWLEDKEKIWVNDSEQEENDNASETLSEQDKNEKEQTLDPNQKILPEKFTQEEDKINEVIESVQEMDCILEVNSKTHDQKREVSKKREEVVFEFDGVEDQQEGPKWDDDDERLNATEETESRSTDSYEAPNVVYQVDDYEILQAAGYVHHDIPNEKYEATPKTLFSVANGKPRSHAYDEKVEGTVEQIHEDMGEVEIRTIDVAGSILLNESAGKTYCVDVNGQTPEEKDKITSELTSGSKNSKEWAETGMRPLMDQVDSFRNKNNAASKVACQSMERKDEIYNKGVLGEMEKEEKLHRERELEIEHLREVEEKLQKERALESERLRRTEEYLQREQERLRKIEEEKLQKERELEADRLRKIEEKKLQKEKEQEAERLRKIEEEKLQKEREVEAERLRKVEEERERQIEREKDRMATDRATIEACERAFTETREKTERAAVERATAEFRQRALAEARERLEKACAEARERSLAEKAMEGRLRVEKATAEARERAERSADDKLSASRSSGMRPNSSSSDQSDSQYQKLRSYKYSQNTPYSGGDGESPQRCKARLERHQRTADRAAKALAEKNMRDLLAQKELAERNRLAEGLDAEVKRWSSGKQGNLRALLSTLQYILGSDSGWQPIPLTEVITTAAVKKAYRKATLCVHPDKLQQRGASIQQKYICEKVFDLLKEAWNKFNSEER